MAYDNTNRGALFRNDDKTDDKHADYRGNVNVEGTEYWIDAWINESKKGTKYMSLRLKKRAAAKTSDTNAADAKASAGIDYSDEIPFAPEWR